MSTARRETRVTLPSAVDGRLYFAQVREDPRVELEALAVRRTDRLAAVSSGGCTALALLARGPAAAFFVDTAKPQNHLVELKLAALCQLASDGAVRFLGGWPSPPAVRRAQYAALREKITPGARAYWDAHPQDVAKGVLESGVSELYFRWLARALRHGLTPRGPIDRLLASKTPAEQRAAFDVLERSRRFRGFLNLVVNRFTLRGTIHDAFLDNAEDNDLPAHFRRLITRVISDVPVSENYFLQQLLGGFYTGALPPYLEPQAQAPIRASADRVVFVDGSFTDFLQTQPDRSLDVYSLSNILEWIPLEGREPLFAEIARTAAPGARLVFRNFLGWTDVPPAYRDRIVEDDAKGVALMQTDRSGMQRRAAVCTIR